MPIAYTCGVYGWNVALHPEGVDRNFVILSGRSKALVALHPEGVDRNQFVQYHVVNTFVVALHPEGVDRNRHFLLLKFKVYPASPSTRRAWIEIGCPPEHGKTSQLVALHPEGVDRNITIAPECNSVIGRPPPGGRG